MKKLFVILGVLGLVLFGVTTAHVMAAEKVMEQETVTTTTEQTNLVKTADNYIILFDSSTSMNEPYLNKGRQEFFDAAYFMISRCCQILQSIRHFQSLLVCL
jgi:hypothetical protein